MQIQDVERETGLDRATIRFYEKENIVVPQRMENGYRTYNDADIALLLKIKLLRQLGVSLFNIKSLQKGTGNFDNILSEQIKSLENQIRLNEQAKFVCAEMQRDGAEYETLDTVHYLKLLESPLVSASCSFQETVKKQAHPWRRYFARIFDYGILRMILLFIVIVVVRIRPFGEGGNILVELASYFIAIPVFAAMLHYWGTTPGKWLMGIKIEDINGGKLSYYDAFVREKDIIWSGLGFFIPILSQWRMYRAYKEDVAGEENDWNHTSEIIYVDWTVTKKIMIPVFYVLVFFVSLFSLLDAQLPKHRGDITIKQFAENHLDYEKSMDVRSELIIGPDGTWIEDPQPHVIYSTIALLEEDGRPDFVYTLENDYIRAVHYDNEWESTGFYNLIPEYCIAAMYSLVGSRPDTTYFDIVSINESISNYFIQVDKSTNHAFCNASFVINDVQITVDIQIDNVDGVYNGMVFALEDATCSCNFSMALEILD